MKRSILFLFLVFFFNSCNHLPEVGIKSVGFGDEIEVLQNLFFEFDEELVFDGDLNKWKALLTWILSRKLRESSNGLGKKNWFFRHQNP